MSHRDSDDNGRDNHDLKALWQSVSEAAEPVGDCPSAELIYDVVLSAHGRGEVAADEAKLLGVVDHLARCPACSDAWQMANALVVDLDQLDTLADPIAPVGSVPPAGELVTLASRRPAAWVAPLALAAALLLGALPAWQWAQQRSMNPSGGEYRGAHSSGITLMPAERLDGGLRLSWSGVPDGAIITVHLADAKLQGMLDRDVGTAAELRLTDEELALLPNRPIYWQLVAVLPSGDVVKSGSAVIP